MKGKKSDFISEIQEACNKILSTYSTQINSEISRAISSLTEPSNRTDQVMNAFLAPYTLISELSPLSDLELIKDYFLSQKTDLAINEINNGITKIINSPNIRTQYVAAAAKFGRFRSYLATIKLLPVANHLWTLPIKQISGYSKELDYILQKAKQLQQTNPEAVQNLLFEDLEKTVFRTTAFYRELDTKLVFSNERPFFADILVKYGILMPASSTITAEERSNIAAYIANTLKKGTAEELVAILQKWNIAKITLTTASQIKQEENFMALSPELRKVLNEHYPFKSSIDLDTTAKIHLRLSGYTDMISYVVSVMNQSFKQKDLNRLAYCLNVIGLPTDQVATTVEQLKTIIESPTEAKDSSLALKKLKHELLPSKPNFTVISGN